MKLSAKGLADCINLSDKLKHLTIHTSNKFVYAILYSDMVVKVGMTKNLRQRVSSLKNGREISDCFVVFSGMGSKVERSAQDRLSDHLINGEYFSCDFGDAAKAILEMAIAPEVLSEEELTEKEKVEEEKIEKFINHWEKKDMNKKVDIELLAKQWIENKKNSIESNKEKYFFVKNSSSEGITCKVSMVDDEDFLSDISEIERLVEISNNESVTQHLLEYYFDLLSNFEIEVKHFNHL